MIRSFLQAIVRGRISFVILTRGVPDFVKSLMKLVELPRAEAVVQSAQKADFIRRYLRMGTKILYADDDQSDHVELTRLMDFRSYDPNAPCPPGHLVGEGNYAFLCAMQKNGAGLEQVHVATILAYFGVNAATGRAKIDRFVWQEV